ncbi:MAG: hypothetical protein ABSF43_17365 [Rectinemataceae bacterium]|jgi:hypothetical protein
MRTTTFHAGTKDAVVSANASCAYVAASGADAGALVPLSAGGDLVGASAAAVKGANGLASFSRPYCLALSPDGSLLAVGTAGAGLSPRRQRAVGG